MSKFGQIPNSQVENMIISPIRNDVYVRSHHKLNQLKQQMIQSTFLEPNLRRAFN